MRSFWVYDWEVYPNFACVSFIHTTTPQNLIDAYIEVDILYLDVKNKLSKLERSYQIANSEYEIYKLLLEEQNLYDLFNKYKLVKSTLFSQMVSKSFIIFKDEDNPENSICQLGELIMFFINHKVIIGYNSFNYDGYITDYIMNCGKNYNAFTGYNNNKVHITEDLKKASDEIINVSRNKLFNYEYAWLGKRYKRLYEDYDIQKILYLDKTYVGLKSVAINLKWHRIQELPLPIDTVIKFNQVYDIFDYNINDVLITMKLVMNQAEEISLREEVSERYDINILNESRSSIGKRLMSKYYELESGIPYKQFKDLRTYRGKMKLDTIIDSKIKFITPELQLFLKQLLKESVTPEDSFHKKLEFRGTYYTFAKGGIHSIDDSRIYDNKEGYILSDCDVNSYYPSIIELFKVSPKHILLQIFIELVSKFKNDRLRAKHEGIKLEAEALKIVINRIYGALGDPMDYLYDPKAVYETTLNGQLSLLMLIEKLEVRSEGNIHCVSANTDGIVCKFLPEYLDLYLELSKEWQNETGFKLEFTEYEKYFRSGVNSYVAIKKGFRDAVLKAENPIKELEKKYIKLKNDYEDATPFSKGFIHPIVSLALQRHAIFGEDYKEIIKTHWTKGRFNILDYCISQKVDKKYSVFYTRVEYGEILKEPLQQYNRFYVCNKGGGAITKEDIYESKSRSQALVANHSVRLFNDYVKEDDYHIDYNFYIRKVEAFLYYRKKNSKGNHRYEGVYVRGNTLFD